MMVKDAVCGRELDTESIDSGQTQVFGGATQTEASHGTKRFHDGQWYYFCSMACRQKFISGPDQYLPEE
jgi:YHS domain-containing protein